MSTPDFEVHRGVVQYSDPATGLSKVRIPALLGADGVVDVPSLGLTYENGFWNVPDVGSSVFVAVSRDRLDFLWLTAVVTPTYRDDTSFVDSLQFDIDAGVVVESEGLLAWNEDWGTVDIGLHGSNAVLHVGQQVYYYAKNQTGAQIDKGTVVRFDGALGASGHLKMAPFLADGTYPSEYIMGITAHDIPDGDDGYVVHFGAVRGIDTATPGWSAGDVVYASPTVTGGLTSTTPSAPNNIILVAAVVNSHAQNGELFVRPTLAANILNDEGIVYTNLADNDVLAYNATTGVFENTSSLDLTTLTTTGNVGIGTTTPQTPLGVNGDIDIVGAGRQIVFGRQSEGGPHGLEVWDSGSLESALYYRTTPNAWSFENSSGTNILTVDIPNSRVGIGTDTPSAPLEISTTNNTEALRLEANFNAGDQEVYITAVDRGDQSILAAIGLGSAGGANDNDGGITFKTTSASSSSIPATQMIINKDGNVGIGTTTPSALLEVANSTEAVVHINDTGGNSYSINSKLWFQSGGIDRGLVGYNNTSNAILSLFSDDGPIRIETDRNDDIEFYVNGSNRMVINGNNGYVGINKTYPNYQLHVGGNVQVDGSVYSYNISDERLKKNIEQYSGGLSLVRQLNPVTYVWDCDEIDDSGDTKIGLIAQEVEAVRPEWVGAIDGRVLVRNSDGQEFTDMSAISLLGTDVQAIMISAIKELADRLDEVSARLATLEGS